MRACPRCGTYAPPHAQFCERCGELLSHAGAGSQFGQGGGGTGHSGAAGQRDDDYPDWNAGPPPLPPIQQGRGAEQQPAWPIPPLRAEDPPTDPRYGTFSPDAGYGSWSGTPPGWTPDEGEPRRGNGGRMALLGAVGLVVVIALMAGGIYLARSGGDTQAKSPPPSPAASSSSAAPSPTPSSSASASTDTPDTQAKAVDGVLDKAVRGKSTLSGAYSKALKCTISPATAETKFTAAARNRRTVVRKARKLHTGRLPHGAKIRRLLVAVYTTSAKADDAFAHWAHAGDKAGKKCLSANAKRKKGNKLSIKANKKKRQFVKAWNPVAKRYGYPRRSADDI